MDYRDGQVHKYGLVDSYFYGPLFIWLFFRPMGLYIDYMLFRFKNRVPIMHQEVSVVWRRSLPLMNNFNKTEAAIFPMQTMLPEGFHFFLWLI